MSIEAFADKLKPYTDDRVKTPLFACFLVVFVYFNYDLIITVLSSYGENSGLTYEKKKTEMRKILSTHDFNFYRNIVEVTIKLYFVWMFFHFASLLVWSGASNLIHNLRYKTIDKVECVKKSEFLDLREELNYIKVTKANEMENYESSLSEARSQFESGKRALEGELDSVMTKLTNLEKDYKKLNDLKIKADKKIRLEKVISTHGKFENKRLFFSIKKQIDSASHVFSNMDIKKGTVHVTFFKSQQLSEADVKNKLFSHTLTRNQDLYFSSTVSAITHGLVANQVSMLEEALGDMGFDVLWTFPAAELKGNWA